MKFPGSMGEMFESLRGLQENVTKAKADLDQREIEASSGGGMVHVKMTGAQVITSLKINPTAVNPADVEMLEDLVRAAVNEALKKSRDMMKEEMSKFTGGLPIPGL